MWGAITLARGIAIATPLMMAAAAAAQPVVSASSDITIDLGAGVVAADDDVSVDNQLGIVLLEGLGGLPSQADVVAYGQELGGAFLLALDTTVDLGGLVARRGDVVRWNGQAYSIVFDASAEGVPANAIVDAVSLAPGGYLLSFDTTVDLGSGIVAHDEDLVRWSSTTGAFTIALSGASIGIPRALDVDGAQDLGGGAFLLSFDTAGTALGVTFDDDDVLRLEGGVLTVEFDGSAAHAGWGAADLDAVMVPEPGVATAVALGTLMLGGLGRGRRRRGALAVSGAALLAASAAHAVDGVQEINQTCAVQTGCFSGDTAGFPVTIDGTAGRSYRLTSDLVVPDENTDGIRVSAPNTSIDLNGFEIVRSGCVGATTDCTPTAGTGSGVAVPDTTGDVRGILVRDGAITGMGVTGVFLGNQAEVRNLRIRWNRLNGIGAGVSSIVSDNTVHQNGSDGIVANHGSSVASNVVYQNGGRGILASTGATVSHNTAYSNGTVGISANAGSTVFGNTAYNNGADGIVVLSGSTVSGNTSFANEGDGIDTSLGCTVQRNTARLNAGFGLRLGSETAYRENVVTSNGAGTVTGGVNLFNNSCNGTTICP
ncbi:MAG: right-handed parallel beta-helix repeat-containing protein [Myxococcota bacterium]